MISGESNMSQLKSSKTPPSDTIILGGSQDDVTRCKEDLRWILEGCSMSNQSQ